MVDEGEVYFGADRCTEIPKPLTIELFTIIDDFFRWDFESACDILPIFCDVFDVMIETASPLSIL